MNGTDLPFAPLKLKRDEERRLRAGHLWVYSNEVDTAATPLSGFEPGQPVEILAHNGRVLGTGYVNPRSLICARLLSRDPQHPVSRSLLVHRLKVALALRESIYDKPYYRLAFGDSDFLPGLIVDRYGDVLVAQLTTAGMERMKAEVVAALEKVVKPRAILLRNDSPIRAMEGLENYVEPALGAVPEAVELEENGVRFLAPLLSGQKTGWFYDHRENRARLMRYVRGRRVLNLFSYLGGWGVQAVVAGASEVVCVDASAGALERLVENAALNGVAERVTVRAGDAFDVLRSLREAREKFDVVILDPPAFIKRKKDMAQGVQAYRRLNQMAMQVLAPDGLLVSASSSFHLPRETLLQAMLQASRHLERGMQVLEQGHQARTIRCIPPSPKRPI